jgi:two-component system response regulator NreC
VSQVTVVLVDDHPVVRQGLRALLETEPGFSVVGEAGNGLEAASLVERLKPTVLLLDLTLPELDGLETLRQVRQSSPQTRVIILSMHSTEAYVRAALRHGAAGYVLKDASAGDLIQAMREVCKGRRYLSPPLSERTIDAYLSAAPPDAYDTLTNREREVLRLVAAGLTNAQIAAGFSISPRTVETHRANLMRKLELHSLADLTRYAMEHGILKTGL